MTIDGFLTFVGLLVALLALASDATRKALLLRWILPLIITVIAVALVLYFQFFNTIVPVVECASVQCPWTVLGGEGRLSAPQVAFIVVLVWLAMVVVNLWMGRLQKHHLPGLAGLLTALAEGKRFGELCRIVAPQFDLIAGVRKGKSIDLTDKQKEAAFAIERLLYQRGDLVRFIVLERPHIAIKLMARNSRQALDFSDAALAILIGAPEGPLYAEIAEIADNRDITSKSYSVSAHSIYLHYFVGDANKAVRHEAWRPVMEAVLDCLQEARGGPYEDFLNRSAKGFLGGGRWQDRTFVGIRFLDLMVDAALRQGIRNHMWLFYLPHVLEALLPLYDENQPGVDPNDERPTRNAAIIYEIFCALTHWIAAINDLPKDAPHLELEGADLKGEGGNIPKSAILALGDGLRKLLVCSAVPDKFKGTIVELVLTTLGKLPTVGPIAGYRQVMVASLVSAGVSDKSDHWESLLAAYEREDFVLQSKVSDLSHALRAALQARPAPSISSAGWGASMVGRVVHNIGQVWKFRVGN